jgi:hypothetical protein
MAVLLSSRTWFSRPERSQPERTRREDRHSKFYEISDNLGLDPDVFLEHLSIEMREAAPATSIRALSELLSLPAATCRAHYLSLNERLAELAGINGEREYEEREAMSKSEILALFERVSEAVDPSALDEAVRSGVCQLLDFQDPLDDERFFDGIDVLPGHVAAGLTVARPQLTDAILRALEDRGAALVVGPSGAGKSALLWMAASQSRQEVVWYRVQRLRDEDVPAVVRLARGASPSANAPIGFIVDNVGRESTAGWDALVGEFAGLEGTLLIGACREEDLLEVRTAASTSQVRPKLDERLAERIYSNLRERARTSWHWWKEPFVISDGLLLEYGHLLTSGRRLEETIRSQIDERRRAGDSRGLELDVLRLVASAHAFGARLDGGRVASHLAISGTRLQTALVRLIDEHLLAQTGDGQLLGLHELRSEAICRELHRVPPLSMTTTAAEIVRLLDPVPLQAFLTRVLLEDVDSDQIVGVLAERCAAAPEPVLLSGVLQALRTAGFAETARQWAQIMKEREIAPMHAGALSFFAIATSSAIDLLAPELEHCVRAMREVATSDPRREFLTLLGHDAVFAALRTNDSKATKLLLAALAETELSAPPEGSEWTIQVEDVDGACAVLEAAREVSPQWAGWLAKGLGGTDLLLGQLMREQAWVREARVEAGNEVAAAGDYAYVAPVGPNRAPR